MERAHIEAQGLVKEFVDGPRSVQVLSGVSFAAQRGETIAIVGESGVGKSTLLHLLGGLERPSAGTMRIGDLDLGDCSDRDLAQFRNRSIGFVFQFHHLLPDFSALENVMMPCLIGAKSYEEARDAAASMLDRVGLAHRMDHRPGELSGGEQQRVAVARAVVHEPEVVLADEPTGNLDPKTGDEVERLLVELNQERSTTCVVVTHSARLASAMGRTFRLEPGGQIAAVDTSSLGDT